MLLICYLIRMAANDGHIQSPIGGLEKSRLASTLTGGTGKSFCIQAHFQLKWHSAHHSIIVILLVERHIFVYQYAEYTWLIKNIDD